MEFSDKEVADLALVYSRSGSRGGIIGVATRAVELVAARGGTMPPEAVSAALSATEHAEAQENRHGASSRLRQHIAAQGARIAELEADLETAKRKRPASFEMEKELERAFAERDALKSRVDVLREKANTCEAEMVRARSECETLKAALANMTDLRDGYRKAGALEHERAEKAEAQVESIRRRAKDRGTIERLICEHGIESGLPTAMRWVTEGTTAPDRFPCSPTCTHDDAANPGHPRGVRAVGNVFKGHADMCEHRTDRRDTCGDCEYDRGAEIMRAACLEAVQRVSQTLGLGPTEQEMFKHAIEGAMP